MNYGFYLPTRGDNATPEALAKLVRHAEAKGFHSVMIADHVVFPVEINSRYPYTVDGSFPGHGDALEQLALMSFIAAHTQRMRLVTSVMVVPHRNPLLTAKTLATIDVLSKGRVTVGIGVGWMKEEFQALHTPDFHQRGKASDEYIDIFKAVWTQDPASYEGAFYSFAPLHCLPHPVQKPHPPIWIGGHSRAAIRCAARVGDGWHPVGANAAVPLPPDEFAPLLSELKQRCEEEGRNFEDLTISFKAPVYDSNLPPASGQRRPFAGGPDEVVEDIHAYGGLGVSELIFDVRTPTLAGCIEKIDHFAEEIMARAEA